MAHLLDMSNDRANMAYVGQVPWHGLGAQLAPGLPLEDWRIAAGLNWEIKKATVQYAPEGVTDGQWVRTVPDRAVLYRSDTKAALSIMHDTRYHIVQPSEILEFYRDLITDSGYTLETAGSLKGGALIWALAKSAIDLRIAGTDVIKPYLLLSTSCDGSMSTVADLTSVRVVCNNTLSMAVGADGKRASIRLPHVNKFDGDAVKRELGLLDDGLEHFATNAATLAGVPVSAETAVNYFAALYAKMDKDGNLLNAPTLEKVVNRCMTLYLNGPGAQLRSANGTAWGLVNAVTRFQDFESRARGNESRFISQQYGEGANIKAKAFGSALALAA